MCTLINLLNLENYKKGYITNKTLLLLQEHTFYVNA